MNFTESVIQRNGGGEKRRALRILVIALLFAGVAAWLVGESTLIAVTPKNVTMQLMGNEVAMPTRTTMDAAAVLVSAKTHAVCGGLLGLAAGLAGGLFFSSERRGMIAGLLGLISGTLVGFSAAFVAANLYIRYRSSVDLDLMPSLAMHGIGWGAIGLTTALVWAIGLGAKIRQFPGILLGGLLGALTGTVVFELVGAIFFAIDETGEPVSKTSLTRLLARILVASFIAVGLALASFPAKTALLQADESLTVDG